MMFGACVEFPVPANGLVVVFVEFVELIDADVFESIDGEKGR